jgi:hypothetical protein
MSPRAFVVVLLCGASTSVHAHRLDEYVQAVQVAVSTDRIGISLSLSPGIVVADAIISRLDRDGDGRILPAEAEFYGREVVADLVVSVDTQPLALTLRRVEVPPIPELRDGVGSIRIEAETASPARTTGSHVLRFENRHRLPGSVYLANVLLPQDAVVVVRRQLRDPAQQNLDVHYDLMPTAHAGVAWMLVAGLVLAAHGCWRRSTSTVCR